jgi:protein-L-isoaspartate(D-aspartate) O-methyltransferase
MADVAPTDHVLDVGCATGYSSALLGQLARTVVALEENPALAEAAHRALGDQPNVKVVRGPLIDGWPTDGPYDAILLQGATEVIPQSLLRLLKDGGRLACVYGAGPQRKAMLYLNTDGEISARPMFDAAAPVLPGFRKEAGFVF